MVLTVPDCGLASILLRIVSNTASSKKIATQHSNKRQREQSGQQLPSSTVCSVRRQLVQKTVPALNLKIDRILLWTDSTIVLSWLATSANKWQTFVANRFSQIQELTAGCEWRHVASASNPADLTSWGTNPETLKNCRLWWLGPEWLSQHQEQWHAHL